MTPPKWMQDELARVGCALAWLPYMKQSYIIPLVGRPFWRRVKNKLGQLVAPGTPNSDVWYDYDCIHPDHPVEFMPPSQHVTDSRFVVVQPVPGPQKFERVVEFVEETGELVPVSPAVLAILATRRDRWDDIDEAIERARAAKEKEDDHANEQTIGPAVERLVWENNRERDIFMNTPPAPKTATGFTIVDRRSNPTEHRLAP